MKYAYLFLMIIGSFGLGWHSKDLEELQVPKIDELSMFDMKSIPSEFIISCSYMIENDEKSAKVLVDFYNQLHHCKRDK